MSANTYHFTPPTCTLEIIGKKTFIFSPKSADSLNKFQFKLKFDDPRQPTSKQVTVWGDRQDLERLQKVLDRYLKQQLKASFQPNHTQKLAETERHPYLASQGLTNHELFLGSIAHDSDRQTITLGTVQLFDLVTALEAYQTKLSTLVDRSSIQAERKIIPWGIGIAAAIAAISTVAIFRPQVQQTAQQQSPPQAAIPELNEITPPTATDSDRQTATPKLQEPLASTTRLPPPPAVETPKPKPDIPDPADYPLADVGRKAGLNDVENQNKLEERSPKESAVSEEANSESINLEPNPTDIASPARQKLENRQEINLDSASDSPSESLETTSDIATQNTPKQLSQIQEVTAYFRDRWQPPADLKQSLEYRLVLREDGSIERVIPLGKAARLYLSQTSIPIKGEEFISPVAEAESFVVRLLLNPDGRVQAFTE